MKGTIKKTLKKIGLTEKEAELYLFLGKRSPLKGIEISKQLKMNKGQTYRILKRLQKKGLIEVTLEYPARFNAVPFERVIDTFIKSKRAEVDLIEESKNDLLSDWKKISQTELESSLEKFSVIEGNKKIYNNIFQMIKKSVNGFSMASTVSDLGQAGKYHVIDLLNDQSTKFDNGQIRILVQISKQNVKELQSIISKFKPTIEVRGTNQNYGSSVFSRMAIQDNEKILLFISDNKANKLASGKEVCLSTNCRSIIEAFLGVYQDFWRDSINIRDRISEIETGRIKPKSSIINNSGEAFKLFNEILHSAQDEVMIATSSKGLVTFWKEFDFIGKWIKKGVSVKIMAPIISENFNAAKELMKKCEVRHIPKGYLETTIIDDRYLFQFKNPKFKLETPETIKNFENMFYTNDHEYVEKTKNMLSNIWMNAFSPSTITLESITKIDASQIRPKSKITDETKKINGMDFVKDEEIPNQLAEKTLLNKFINNKRAIVNDLSNDLVIQYANAGQAVIHPSKDFNLPHLLFHFLHMTKKSSFGLEDSMIILSRQKTPNGYLYLPASFITDNPKALEFWKVFFKGFPFEQNLVKEDEFHIQVQNNILFAGWTIPISLSPHQDILPPSCVMIEGYGKVKSAKYSVGNPSGYVNTNEVNYFDAFVTYMHPQSQYSGPGTDGYFFREFYTTVYPPSKQKK